MTFGHSHGRKAISPVIATVILIAITLIAAIAIAGFVFGLFGSFTSSAQVTATASCVAAGTPPTCTVSLSNTGTASTNVLSATITFAGSTNAVALDPTQPATGACPLSSGAFPATLTAGQTCSIIVDIGSGTPTTGSQFIVTLSLANSAQPQATGVFQ
jgi:archaeal type IV pilus assembly protein PilA